MSRTAKRPRGGKSEKASTHMGLEGSRRTIPASPDLINLGAASVVLPVRRSTFSRISELAGNVSGVAIQDGRVSIADLSRMVQDDDLGGEVLDSGGRLVLGVGGNVSTLDVLDRHVLDVESNVVSGKGLSERLVVHLHGLDLSGQLNGGEGHEDSRLQDASLHSAHGHCANSSNFVNILEGKAQGLVCGSLGRDDGIEALKECDATGLSFLALHGPSLVPGHVGGGFNHVVAMEPGDGHEGHSGGVVSDLLDEAANFLLDLLEPGLGVGGLGGVHLVDGHDELLDPEGVGEESVLEGALAHLLGFLLELFD